MSPFKLFKALRSNHRQNNRPPVGSRAALQIAGEPVVLMSLKETASTTMAVNLSVGRPGDLPSRFETICTRACDNAAVDVVASLAADMPPFSDLQTTVRLYNPGDLNRDGRNDLVIYSSEADVLAAIQGLFHLSFHGRETS